MSWRSTPCRTGSAQASGTGRRSAPTRRARCASSRLRTSTPTAWKRPTGAAISSRSRRDPDERLGCVCRLTDSAATGLAPPEPGQGRQGARLRRAGTQAVGCGSSREASPALAGSGKGGLHPEVGAGGLRLRPGGLPVPGLAAGAARAARPAVDLAFPACRTSCPARSIRRSWCPVRRRRFRGRARSRRWRVSRDRRPARGPRRGRARSRGLAGRSRRVACEPPPVRLRSGSGFRFRARTARRNRARAREARSIAPRGRITRPRGGGVGKL